MSLPASVRTTQSCSQRRPIVRCSQHPMRCHMTRLHTLTRCASDTTPAAQQQSGPTNRCNIRLPKPPACDFRMFSLWGKAVITGGGRHSSATARQTQRGCRSGCCTPCRGGPTLPSPPQQPSSQPLPPAHQQPCCPRSAGRQVWMVVSVSRWVGGGMVVVVVCVCVLGGGWGGWGGRWGGK